MKKIEFFGASRATRQRHFQTSSNEDEKTDNQATRKLLCTYLLDRLQAFIHGQINPEKGHSSEPLASLFTRQVVSISKNKW